MRSIKRRFENVLKRNPHWSSYICFAEGISGQNFSQQMIHRWFYKLVDNNDYSKSDKRALLEQLGVLTNAVRTTRIEGKKPP